MSEISRSRGSRATDGRSRAIYIASAGLVRYIASILLEKNGDDDDDHDHDGEMKIPLRSSDGHHDPTLFHT